MNKAFPFQDLRTSDLLVHKEARHALPSSNAHASQTDLLLRPPRLTENGAYLPGASCTQWVTQGNSTTPGVDLLVVETKHVQTIYRHRGKGFVDLNDVDVVLGQTELLEQFGDGHRWADTHDSRRDPGHGCAAELCHDGLAQSDGFRSFHENYSGSCVQSVRFSDLANRIAYPHP
jgi:hypothetical protein